MLERRVLELGLERPRRVRRPLPLDRRALRSARGDRRLRDAVPQPGADRLRRAHLRDRRRLRRRLDAVLVRAGHARLGRRHARAVRRPGRARRRGLRLRRAARDARRGAGGGAADRLRRSRGRRSPRRPPSVLRRGARARAAAQAHRRRRPAARRACAPTTCSRSSTTSASCSTRTGSSPTATAATASTTSPASPSSRSRSRAAATSRLWTSILYRALAFLHAADGDGGMRNFMGYDRRWLDEPHVGDHVGRSVWALGEILATAWIPAVVVPARDLLARLVGALARRRLAANGRLRGARPLPPRRRPARARGAAPARAPRRAARRRVQPHRDRGLELVRGRAQLRQRTALAGAHQRRQRARTATTWSSSGSSRCAGSATSRGLDGRRAAPAGPPRPAPRTSRSPGRGDEQPLDAAALVEAELAAFAITARAEHGVRATRAFEWFLGRNRLQKPLYDFATGGCSDGLGSEALNQNEGAESTLAFHRAALAPRRGRRPRRRARARAPSRRRRERRASSSAVTPATRS